MKNWIIKTHHKKCILERQFWSNNEKDIVKRTIWRSGSWKITTNDSQIPNWVFTNTPGGDEAKDSVDIYSYPGNFDDAELIETWDGGIEVEWPDDIDDKEKSRLESIIEEDIFELEEEDWFHEDTEMWIWGPIEIQDENGKTVKIVCADKDGNMIDYIDPDEQ